MATDQIRKNITQRTPQLRFPGFTGKWEVQKLGMFAKIYDGTHQTPNYVKEGVPFYSVEHVTANKFSETKFITHEVFEQENRRVKLEIGDILMTRIGDIGTARLIDWDVKASFYVSLALIKIQKTKKLYPGFLAQYIGSRKFQKELWKRTIHVAFPKKINLGEIGECYISFPLLAEQKKIASFLGLVDRWIENKREQRVLLEKYKKGIIQKLFSQDIRFKDEAGGDFADWQETTLGHLFEEVTEKVGNRKVDTYSITAGLGYISQKEKFGRDISGSQNEKYVLLKPGQFSYNKGNSKTYKYGCIYLNNEGEDIAVPNVFISFEFKDSRMVPKYFEKYFEAHSLDRGLRSIISSTARMDGLLNVSKSSFFSLKINYPPSFKEQQKIANFLSLIDKAIEIKVQQITKAEEWKKGLTQKLFV